MCDMIDAALRYAALGLRVHPLRKRSKRPLLKNWPAKATVDPDVIAAWFEKRPDANLGIATGAGLIAIDIDPDRGGVEAFSRKVRGPRKLPFTAMVETGAGGFHFFLRVPPGLRFANRVDFWPGVDVRGDGGYVVAAPSIHPDTGHRYRWVSGPEPIADSPRWLINRLLADPAIGRPEGPPLATFDRSGNARTLLAEMIAKFPVPGPGLRNDRMGRAVASLVSRGYEPGLIMEVLAGWHQHFADRMRTPPDEALKLAWACVESSMRSRSLRRATSSGGHRAGVEAIQIGDLREIPGSPRTREPGNPTNPTGDSVTPALPDGTCRTPKEAAFIEALTAYYAYKFGLGEAPVRFTRGQLAQAVEDRHGYKLNPNEVERLFRRFVSRPGRPASRYELAIQTGTGRPGTPSTLELTGLAPFLGHQPSATALPDVEHAKGGPLARAVARAAGETLRDRLASIARHLAEESGGTFWLARDPLAELLGTTPDRVSEAVRELLADRVIDCVDARYAEGKAIRYALATPPDAAGGGSTHAAA